MLVVGAFVGRAGGLILLGLVAAVALAATSVVGRSPGSTSANGERLTVAPASASACAPTTDQHGPGVGRPERLTDPQEPRRPHDRRRGPGRRDRRGPARRRPEPGRQAGRRRPRADRPARTTAPAASAPASPATTAPGPAPSPSHPPVRRPHRREEPRDELAQDAPAQRQLPRGRPGLPRHRRVLGPPRRRRRGLSRRPVAPPACCSPERLSAWWASPPRASAAAAPRTGSTPLTSAYDQPYDGGIPPYAAAPGPAPVAGTDPGTDPSTDPAAEPTTRIDLTEGDQR